MSNKPKFRVGQIVHFKDWKGTPLVGEVVQADKQEDGFCYMVHWEVASRIYLEEKSMRPLTKRERGMP